MEEELQLTIEFSRRLTEPEMNEFWDTLVDKVEKMDSYAGGGHDSQSLEWTIDISKSKLERGEIIDEIGDLLLEMDDIILNFRIK